MVDHHVGTTSGGRGVDSNNTKARGPGIGTITIGLVVLMLVGVVLSWWFLLEAPRRAVNRSIALVEMQNGYVETVSSRPEWLASYVDETFAAEYFRWVVGVRIESNVIPPAAEARTLAAFRHLEWLHVNGSSRDLRPMLSRLPRNDDLQRLVLNHTNAIPPAASVPNLETMEVSGPSGVGPPMAGFEQLADYDSVEALDVRGWQDAGPLIVHLDEMESLEYLLIGWSAIPDDGLESVGRCERLRSLSIDHCWVRDPDTLQPIGGATTLERLSVRHTFAVDESVMREIGRLRNLTHLNLDDTPAGDDGAVHLAGLRNLETLSLRNTRLTSAGLQHLVGLGRLWMLDLSRANGFGGRDETGTRYNGYITHVAPLAELPSLQTLKLQGTAVDDAALPHLVRLPTLRRLDLSQTCVTEESYPWLAEMTWLLELRIGRVELTNDQLATLGRSMSVSPRFVPIIRTRSPFSRF